MDPVCCPLHCYDFQVYWKASKIETNSEYGLGHNQIHMQSHMCVGTNEEVH